MTALDRTTQERIQQALDNDGLVRGTVFDDLEQEDVRIGDYWVGLDRRIPWQLAQGIRSQFTDLASVRLRLDLSRIEPRAGHMTPLRKAYWWGAKFDWAKIRERRQGRDSRHGDFDRLLPRLAKPPQATFRWNFPRDEAVGEFQIEEFSADLGQALGTRYLHAILDSATERFVHVDGALKVYSEAAYGDAYADGVSKASVYEKLFRVDSAMDRDSWMVLAATFFTGSKLVESTFDGE